MGKGRELTEDERKTIFRLRSQNPDWPLSKIGEAVGRDRSTIGKVLRSPENKPRAIRTGRPKITTKRENRELVRLAKKDRLSVVAITNKLELDFSSRTVHRRLVSDPTTRYGKHKSKPVLNKRHREARLAFATEMVSLNDEEWAKIVWSDEKKWNLDGPDGLRCFGYDIRKDKAIFSKRQNGGGGVMVWAGFAFGGRTDLAFCKSKMNSSDYQDILGAFLLPSGPLITNGDYILQQDNAPIHASKSTSDWLQANNVKILKWPALSPDLNPIENLWGYLTRKVYQQGRQFRSIDELKSALIDCWKNVPDELLKKLVRSMKDRMIKVIQNRGGPIDYYTYKSAIRRWDKFMS